jgi:hypothetical protein
MKAEFDVIVQQLREIANLDSAVTLWKNADDIDRVLKLSTGVIANGLSRFDATRLDKLLKQSKVDPWSHDAMKLGAIELQKMHPLLSEHSASWSGDFMSGNAGRPSKSGPQANFAREMCKSLIHALVEDAEELGLKRGRHKTTLDEHSAIDAVKKALEISGLFLSYDAIESYDKAGRKDPDQKNLTRFFPTEKF